MKQGDGRNKFYCPRCDIVFSLVDKEGRAVCPMCQHEREDKFNQISSNMFKCMVCKCIFTVRHTDNIVCPNNCS